MNHNSIITAARDCIGTPFHHQGRRKGVGLDCLGLLVEVARALSLRSRNGMLLVDLDELNYSHQPDTQRLLAMLSTHLHTTKKEDIAAGDIVVLRVDKSPQHMGIIGDYQGGLGMIHAYAPARKVVEHGLDEYWREKITSAFRITS